MTDNNSIETLITKFKDRGGRVDKFYLRETNRSKKTLVHLNGWFTGNNLKEAIMKAFEK